MRVQQEQRILTQVLEELQKEVISRHYNNLLYRHPSITRTIELIKQHYKFLNIKDKVTKFIKNYVSCQQNKHSTHAKYREAQAIETLTALQTNIKIDFVTQLPVSKDPVTRYTYNLIFVIVDRFTKYAKIILFCYSYTAEQLAQVFLDRIICYYSILELIISNRDKLFILNYQTMLLAAIGTKKKLLTAYYLQIDRQTKRTNQTIEIYL